MSKYRVAFMLGIALFGGCIVLNARGRDIYTDQQTQEAAAALQADEKELVFDSLLPLYQKIYLFVLNDEERRRVVHYVRKGLTPYEAIDTLLRVEERQYNDKNPKKSLTPAERAEQSKSPPVHYK